MIPSKRVYIIAEAGSNWKADSPKADWRQATELVSAAKAAGADAVKFQLFRAFSVYVPNAGSSDYLSKNGVRESIVKLFDKMAMPYEMVPKLQHYCRDKNIDFLCSAFSANDFRFVDRYVKFHKIASYEISHPELLALAAKSKKPLILSTGAATTEDIDWAVSYFRRQGGKELILMQCTAKYPAPFESLNLRAIQELGRRYHVPVGFSDHSRDAQVAPVAAVALGARILEKHFTLDNRLAGPDHAFAVTPLELKAMVTGVRACEKALGDGQKKLNAVEKELRSYAQRALQATTGIRKGEMFSIKKNLAVLRPGKQKKGLHPRFLSKIEGRRARRAVALGQGLSWSDVS